MLGFVTPPDVSKSFIGPPKLRAEVDVTQDPALAFGGAYLAAFRSYLFLLRTTKTAPRISQ
jgi:hypothetical protein